MEKALKAMPPDAPLREGVRQMIESVRTRGVDAVLEEVAERQAAAAEGGF
jgi:hypothetical protein